MSNFLMETTGEGFGYLNKAAALETQSVFKVCIKLYTVQLKKRYIFIGGLIQRDISSGLD